MTKGNGIELLKKNHLELGLKYQKSMERLKDKQVDLDKQTIKLFHVELDNTNKDKRIRRLKDLNNALIFAVSLAAVLIMSMMGEG